MKKILLFLAVFALGLSLAGCKDKEEVLECADGQIEENGVCVDEPLVCPDGQHEENGVCVDDTLECPDGQEEQNGECVVIVTDQMLVDAAMDELAFDVTEALMDFDLPVLNDNGTFYSWYSNNAAIAFNADGDMALVTRPAAGEEDVTVTLTVVGEKGLASAELTFDVLIPAIPGGVAEKLAEAKKSLRFDEIFDLDNVVETSFLLPERSPLYSEVLISWEIVAYDDLPNVPEDPGMPAGYIGVDEDGRDAYIEGLVGYDYCMVDATDDLTGAADTLDETHDIKDVDFVSYADGTNVFADGVAEAACGWAAYGANGAGGQAFLVEHGVWDMYPVYNTTDGERDDAAVEATEAYDQYLIDAAYFLAYDATVMSTVDVAEGQQVTITRPADADVNVRVIATLSWDDIDVTVDALEKEFEFVVAQAPQDDATRLEEAVEDFEAFGIDFVDGNFSLPMSGLYDVVVSWESANTNLVVVDAEGNATVASPLKNSAVTLTATLTIGTETATKSFVAVVVGTEATYTYRSSISNTTNINPHNETLANASTLYGYITGGLYGGNIDWDASIAAGAAASEGDFSNTAALVYDYLPYLADEMPVDVNGDQLVWSISLREDLEWQDGTPIDAHDFVYSYMMLLDPRLANARAGGFYNDIKIVGAEAYAKQDTTGLGVNDDYTIGFDTVGIEATDDYTIQLTLTTGTTSWDLRGNLTSGIMGPVHEGLYEGGMNETRTITDYGSAGDKIMSYGPFNLVSWEPGVVFIYERNDAHFDAVSYRMTHVRYDVIEAQSVIVNEFKAGRLDVAGVSGVYYPEFKNNPNVVLSPATTTFRWATNVGPRGDEQTNPMMAYKEFRQALYHAVNRQEMVSSVNAPALAQQAYLSPEYIISDTSSLSYRASEQGTGILADLYPETAGYNPVQALALFNAAYQKASDDGVLPEDGLVWVELAMKDAETNWTTNNWVADVVTKSFDAQPGGSNEGKFEFRIAPYSSDALDVAEANANFDIMFYGWTGLKFDPIALMGYVWNENFAYMNEKGWAPGANPVEVSIPNYQAQMDAPVEPTEVTEPTEVAEPTGYVAVGADGRDAWYDALTDTTEADAYDAYVVALGEYNDYLAAVEDYDFMMDIYADGVVTLTFHEWFMAENPGGFLYADYDGRDNDLLNICAGMEAMLLEEVVGIPLFTSVGTAVYSDRVVFEFQAYHAWMAWGGLEYMYLNAPDPVN
jgi:ABC-type transport system substrate-binding protein